MNLILLLLEIYSFGWMLTTLLCLTLFADLEATEVSTIDIVVFTFLWPITVPYAVAMIVGEVIV